MIVLLRPISPRNWSGLKPGGKYRGCYEDIAPYWTRSGRIYTGLIKADEDRLGLELGEDLKPNSEFWKNFYIRTSGRDLYLDLEDPMNELKHLFLKGHKRVKASLSEQKATANFVLINKDEEAKRSNVYNKIRREAIKSFDDLSPDDMRRCLRLYGHNGDELSNEVAENRLFEIVEGNPQAFLDRWVHNKQRDLEVIIEQAISKNIIRRNKNIYKYGTEVIGHTLQETADFLSMPKNQDVRIVIMKQIETKSIIEGAPFKDVYVNEVIPTEKKVSDADKEMAKEVVKAAKPKTKKDTI
jgi:hypothetical protein